MQDMVRMQELVTTLNKASEAYYGGKDEIMSNYTYDNLEKELIMLEAKTGVILDDSPTKRVSFSQVQNGLKKVKHKFPAKSLDKTKDIDKIVSLMTVQSSNSAVVMWKLDGSTIQLTYFKGHLVNAATRGDGVIGSDITENSKYIKGIPQTISEQGLVTVRGEALMSYVEFSRINLTLPDDKKFKNPRNLASATITVLDTEILKSREIHFKAFQLVSHPELSSLSFSKRLDWCSNNGFDVVEHSIVSNDNVSKFKEELKEDIESWESHTLAYDYPVDGLVVAYNYTNITDNLEGTEHHPHPLKGYALKWKDETVETTLREIEWSPSRTGLLNPVAIFDPVDLEGTTVTRASLHNLSVMAEMNIQVGDRIEVFKANKIIPQVASNNSKFEKSNELVAERVPFGNLARYADSVMKPCPCCGRMSETFSSENNILTVYCVNPSCKMKLLGKLEHYCSRGCRNIEGLSSATLEKFIDCGFVTELSDLYKLDAHRDEIVCLEGFGEKSYQKIWGNICKSKSVTFIPFITSLGIDGVGSGQAKYLNDAFDGDIEKFIREGADFDYTTINTFGDVLNDNLHRWFSYNISESRATDEVLNLIAFLSFEKEEKKQNSSSKLEGLTFVVTGKVEHFNNREEVFQFIESNGGKTSGSVNSKTSYLINNDVTSTSGKNKKALELGVKIISEDELISMVNAE